MRNDKLDIIIFPFHDWKYYQRNGFCTRDGHLIQHFKKNASVQKMLIIDRPTSVLEMVFKKCWWRVKNGKVIYKKTNICLTCISEKIYVLDFLSFDLFRPFILKRLWWKYIFKQPRIIREINKAIKFLNLENEVLFMWNPFAVGVVGKIGEKIFVYDGMDNWARHPEMRDIHKTHENILQRIKTDADLIFTVSAILENIMKDGRKNVFCIPNGVDSDFIDLKKDRKMPNDLMNIPRPIIGYSGSLAQRIDINLIKYLSAELPNVNFVFIGPTLNYKWIKPLFKINNIYLLGNKDYSSLTDYLLGFDICIIPHNVGELENDGDPIKLYEYLAAGKPVVTTNIAGVDVFRKIITIAKTKEEFAEGIRKYIQILKRGEDISERLRGSISPDCFWATKADRMVAIMQKCLRTKALEI